MSSQDGSLRGLHPEVGAPSLGATASQGEASLLFYFGHITDPILVAAMVDDAGPLWRVKARKVLDYLITKHPKVASTVSVVLDGLMTAVVQSVGTVAVAVSEWLETALDSAAAKAAAHSQVVRRPSRMPMRRNLKGGCLI